VTEPEPSTDTRVENSLLRVALGLAVRALKSYHDAPHFEIEDDHDGKARMEVIVPTDTREKAADALARAEGLLKGQEPARGR
jgi:hypothetical protein